MRDEEFLDGFERCTLPEEKWTHEAHFRMAWLYLRREPNEAAALEKAREGIKRYNAARGGPPDKYHETVTVAYVRLVASRMRQNGTAASGEAFVAENGDLIGTYPGTLLHYYSEERLFSQEAHESFLEPDLKPLPSGAVEGDG